VQEQLRKINTEEALREKTKASLLNALRDGSLEKSCKPSKIDKLRETTRDGLIKGLRSNALREQVIKVDKDDISDVNFIVFLKATTFQITAYVDTAVELLRNIKIQVFSEDDLDSPVHSLSPGMVKFLQFPHLQIKTYVVKIESSLSSKTHDIKTTSVTVTPDANTLKKHIRLKFDAQKKRIDMEPTQSVIALPLAVALVFICYNYDTALALLMKINSFIQNINKKEDSDASSDDDEDSSKSSKRKKR
jgi:hypothetical protein